MTEKSCLNCKYMSKTLGNRFKPTFGKCWWRDNSYENTESRRNAFRIMWCSNWEVKE